MWQIRIKIGNQYRWIDSIIGGRTRSCIHGKKTKAY